MILSTFLLLSAWHLTSRGEQQRRNYDVLEKLLGLGGTNQKTYEKYIDRKFVKYLLAQAYDVHSPETQDETYDFIIVGSGSAGSVIANRLTEVPQWQVLLLEAGRVENALTAVPIIAPVFQFTEYDWKYLMEHQEGIATGTTRMRMAWPKGRALGGSTVINYMIYTRGNPLDFDRWAEAAGDPGWSYREILPYFLKSENASLRRANPRYHGRGGEWSVEDSYQGELARAFVDAGRNLGYDYVDYATPEQIGFSTVQANTLGGRRHSAYDAFLKPIKRTRRNLHIRTSCYVTKLLIDPETKRAHGVEYQKASGETRRAYATKEVVLSAGTISSPQLLMLSGVGPRLHLSDLGIPLVQELPVGEFLQDHLTFVGLTFTVNQSVSLDVQRGLRTSSIRDWLNEGRGPLTSLGGVEGLAYVQVLEQGIPDYPDVELLFIGGALNSDYGLASRRSMRIRDDVYYPVWRQLFDVPTWSAFPMLLHPRSVGGLRLRSRNPHDYPLLYGNYLTDGQDLDLKTLIASIRFVIELSKTQAFQKYGSKLHEVPIPGCEGHTFDSDRYWECAIRSLGLTLHHQVGTCKMGRSYDPTAVVDNELRVYGVGNLRVADCSVIPFAIGAHTSAPAVMIGEKAADLIKNTWLTSSERPS